MSEKEREAVRELKLICDRCTSPLGSQLKIYSGESFLRVAPCGTCFMEIGAIVARASNAQAETSK